MVGQNPPAGAGGSAQTLDMALCPNCNATVAIDADCCTKCGALFTPGGWSPLESQPHVSSAFSASKPKARASLPILVLKLGVASLLISVAAFAVGGLTTLLVPGCHCDSGAGCGGCGLNDLVAFLLYGGFLGALLSIMFVIPASAVLAAVIALYTKLRGSQAHHV